MRAFLLFVMMALAGAAGAETLTASRGNGDTVRLTDEPCTNETVLGHIAENVREFFSAGSGVVDGVSYQLCWRRFSQFAFLVYEDSDEGFVPWRELKPAI